MLLQRDILRRLGQDGQGPQAAQRFRADLRWISIYLSEWVAKWCTPESSDNKNWHLLHDSLSSRLLLTAQIAKLRAGETSESELYRREMLEVSTRIFEEALARPGLTHMTHRSGAISAAASILLRLGDRRDLVLRLALRMAGDPNKSSVPTWVNVCGRQMMAMLW